MDISEIAKENVRYRAIITMFDKGQTESSLIQNLDGFTSPQSCYSKLKQMEISLKTNQERTLRANGDNVSTLDLDFNDSQYSITACANDRERGLQFLHIVAVEPYDITRPKLRVYDDDWYV